MAAVSVIISSGLVLRISRPFRVRPLCRTYRKKVKGRVKDVQSRNIDLNKILGGNTKTSTQVSNVAAKSGAQDRGIKMKEVGADSWQNSEERVGLLKKGEKRSAFEIFITHTHTLSLSL